MANSVLSANGQGNGVTVEMDFRGAKGWWHFSTNRTCRESGYNRHFRDYISEAARIPMKTGTHGSYKWLEADHDLHEFLSLCPDAIVGRHVAITAVDSGSFSPSEHDRAAGWTDTGGIAYSPRLESVAMLPSDCCCRECFGFDEWYIFETDPTPLGSICHANVFETAIASPNVFQFINFGGFQLSDPEMKAITDLFWTQMAWVRPESYLGDGERCLVFVSSDHQRFSNVNDILSRSPSRNAN